MMNELRQDEPGINVQVLGVNQIGAEAGNAENCDGRTIPWLQDTSTDQVWLSWAVTYRDVVILDDTGVQVDVYNLSTHDLRVQANYDELKARILAAR